MAQPTREEIKAVLEKKGYKFPEFKTPKARAKFIGEHGYDPNLLLIDTVSSADMIGPKWKNFIPECPKKRRSAPTKRRKKK